MEINPAIFRAYDIRGKAGKDLTFRVVEAVGKAFGSYIRSLGGSQVSVSRDNRESSQELASDFIRGVISTGTGVADLGLTTTPMLYFSIIKLNLSGGAIITGSHSDPDYNGIKLCKKQALHIFGSELKKIQGLAEEENFAFGQGKLSKQDIFDKYKEEILNRVELSRTLRVAVDGGDGVAGPFAPDIFEALGCRVFRYACRPLSSFPHGGADPSVPKNLADLAKIVVENKAEVGVGFDADGDRLGVVDEKGRYVPVEKIAALITNDILKGQGKKFAFDVKSLLGFKTVVERLSGQVEMLPTGRSFFRQKLFEDPGVLLGVESSGHIFLNDNFYGFDDGIFAAARLLEVLSKSRESLSKLLLEFPQSFYTPEIQLPCLDERKFKIVGEVKHHFSSKYDTIEIDGVRVKFDKKSWFLVRAKNTGPYLSLRFESDTKEKIFKMARIVAVELKRYPELSQDWVKDVKANIFN